jgi:hypothetical protein
MSNTTTITDWDADGYVSMCEAPHDAWDEPKRDRLAADMAAHGWRGRPILVYCDGNGYTALTGSHRIKAAEMADVDVPVMECDFAKLEAHGEAEGQTINDMGFDEDRLRYLLEAGDTRAAQLMYAEMAANGQVELAKAVMTAAVRPTGETHTVAD